MYMRALSVAIAALFVGSPALAVPPTPPAPTDPGAVIVNADLKPDHLLHRASPPSSDPLLDRNAALTRLLPASWPRFERRVRAISARPAILMGRDWPQDARMLEPDARTRLLQPGEDNGELLSEGEDTALLR